MERTGTLQHIAATAALVLIGVWASDASAAVYKVYYTYSSNPTHEVRSANLDGTGIQTVSALESGTGPPAAANPSDVEIDLAGGKMYWVDIWQDKVRRANLDGTGQEDLLATGAAPRNITLNTAIGRFYWIDDISNQLRSANFDGTSAATVFSGLSPALDGSVAVDPLHAKIYYSHDGAIKRANLDGSGVEVVVSESAGGGIELDVENGYIYFASGSEVRRANLDGTGSSIKITATLGNLVNDLALDLVNRKVYYAESSGNRFWVADLDVPSTSGTILFGLAGAVSGIALLVPEPGAAAMLLVGCMTALLRRRPQAAG